MDIHDIWQENKRWILGCGIGLLLFWVGTMVIHSVWDSASVRIANRNMAASIGKEDLYSQAARSSAQAEAEDLQKLRGQAEGQLVFTAKAPFVLDGQEIADVHFDKVSREVRSRINSGADEAGIDVAERALQWSLPAAREDIGAALVGLQVVDEFRSRLLAAHQATRNSGSGPERGVAGIDLLRVEINASGPRRKEEGALDEQRVAFTVRADSETIVRFLESCRSQSPPLALGPDFKIEGGKLPGDPLRATGRLLALTLRPQATN